MIEHCPECLRAHILDRGASCPGQLRDNLILMRKAIKDLMQVMLQLSNALAYIHERGMVLGDLNPSGILVSISRFSFLSLFIRFSIQ